MPTQTSRTMRTKGEALAVSSLPPTPTHSLWPLVLILSMLLLGALSGAGYFYYQYRESVAVTDTQAIEELTEEVGQLLLLPENETPTLATVTDKAKLEGQPFFQKAENGDKVLIYSQSGRAILYRPSIQKIIDVTTVNLNAPIQTEESPTTEAVAPQAESGLLRVALLNGSSIVGITNAKEKELTVAYPNVAVVSKETAKKTDYVTTSIVDLTGKNSAMAQALADFFQGTVVSLPTGEIAPANADLLVIFGQS